MKEKEAGWLARVHFASEGGRLVIAELSVKPRATTAPAGGVTVKLLRQVLNRARPGGQKRKIEGVTLTTKMGVNPDTIEALRAARGSFLPRRGRRPIPIDTLLSVASDYADAVDGGSTQPVVDVAKKLRMKPERARDLVHRARYRGLLTPAQQGRSGGKLTPNAKRLIARGKKGRRGKKR